MRSERGIQIQVNECSVILVSVEIYQISYQGQKLNTFIEICPPRSLPTRDKDRKCFAQKTLRRWGIAAANFGQTFRKYAIVRPLCSAYLALLPANDSGTSGR